MGVSHKVANRNPADDAFLKSREWRDKIRPVQMARYPLCADCLLLGRTELAEQIDHLVVPNGNVTLQRDFNNLRSLCAGHHAEKKPILTTLHLAMTSNRYLAMNV